MLTSSFDIFCCASADRAPEGTLHRPPAARSIPTAVACRPLVNPNRIEVIGHTSMVAARETNSGRPDGHRSRSANRAFILEDNEANAFLMESYLELHGYQETVRAKSLKEYYTYKQSIIDGEYDIVILDVMLPDGESLQELKELKDEHVFPVCVYTARTSTVDKAVYQRLGCDAIIEKPASLDGFRKIHARLMDQEA